MVLPSNSEFSIFFCDPHSERLNVVNEAELDFFFLEFPWFFYDPVDFGNLISGSSAFSKPILYIWKFLVHILLKSNLKDFDHYLAISGNECNCMVV